MQMADAPHSLEAMQDIVAQFFDGLGVLVEGGVIEPDVAFELFPVPWGKVEPIIQGMRRELEWADMFDHFEALAKLYRRWWEEKRKRLKLAGGGPPAAAEPHGGGLPPPGAGGG